MSRSVLRWPLPALLGTLLVQSACEPLPDYRLVVRSIPAGTRALVVGALLDGDVAAKTFQVVPVGSLDDAARAHFTIGLATQNSDVKAGLLSVGTVDANGCLTSVASSNKITRSSALSSSTTEIQLDPCLNPGVFELAVAYESPMLCPKIPGLGADKLDEPQELPTHPVIIRTRRLISSTNGVLEGVMTAYGWGMDRGTLAAAINRAADPTNCFASIQNVINMSTPPGPQRDLVLAVVTASEAFYPNYTLNSYAQAELHMSTRDATSSLIPPALVNQLILCFAVTEQIYTKVNPDGKRVVFQELVPSDAMQKAAVERLRQRCGVPSAP